MRQNLTLFFVLLSFSNNLAENEYVGNPDDSNDIERPCAVYDIRCIRKYFAEHGKCAIATGPAPDPYIRSQTTFYVSNSNTSGILRNVQISGLNGRITEFYLNKETDNVVLAVDFQLDISGNDTYFVVHRRAKEPVVTSAPLRFRYQSVVVTGIIPKIYDLQLNQFEATAFVNDVTPLFFVGPGMFATTDPGALGTLIRQEDNVPVDISEQFLTDSTFFLASFIQYNICDFGLKVI